MKLILLGIISLQHVVWDVVLIAHCPSRNRNSVYLCVSVMAFLSTCQLSLKTSANTIALYDRLALTAAGETQIESAK